MNEHRAKLLVTLIRQHLDLILERVALRNFLSYCASQRVAPIEDWPEHLETLIRDLKQSAVWRNVVESIEPQLSRLEQGADETEVIRLLRDIAEGKVKLQ